MLFLRSVRVVSQKSRYNNKVVDIIIEHGKITKIGIKLNPSKSHKVISLKGLCISPGFVDINSYIGEPGFEQHETIETATLAASKGGITHFCVMPNLHPITASKSTVEFLNQYRIQHPTTLHPIGAVSQNLEGKDLADLYDMHNAGAIAFSDGNTSIPSAGLMERALLYTSNINTLVIQHPEDKSISNNGCMHEGEHSTRLGLPAIPSISEEIVVSRDLSVLEYTNGKLLFIDISTQKSVSLIANAKKKKLQVYASCNAYNLLLTDKNVAMYDTNCKVNPPLRDKTDVASLKKAIKDGIIDCIASQHRAQDEENKKLEFDKASFGMIGFETFFAVTNTALKDGVDISQIISLISEKPREILGIHEVKFEEGADADFVLYDPKAEWTFEETDIYSKSKNSPFIGFNFTGKIYGTILGNKQIFSPLILSK